MATDALTKAIMQGLDPGVYRPLSDIQQGEALQAVGQDTTPTSKWGAIGRLANAAAGSYITNSATSDLAKTIAGGKKSAQDQLLAAIEAQQAAKAGPVAVPSAPPASAAPPTAPLQPAVQPAVPQASVFPPAGKPTLPTPAPNAPDQDSANAVVANRTPGGPAFMQSAQYQAPEVPENQPPATMVAAATPTANAPRGIRNNNPLNIEAGDFTKGQPGFAGSDGRFAKFDTPENGLAAAHKLLDIYDTKHGVNTVAGIVNRLAPPSDGNNTTAYAADVAGKLGIDPNVPVPKEMRPALVAAMAQHENGVPVPGADQAPYKVAGPAVAAPKVVAKDDEEETATPGAAATPAKSDGLDTHKLLAVLQNPYSDDATKQLAQKLLLEKLTPKEDEFASSPQGIYNKRTGELKQGNGATSDFGGLQGKDLLTAVQKSNPAVASQVTAIIEGRAPYPTGSRLNPVQQQVKELVTQVDPTFEVGNSGARIKVRNEFYGGGPNSPAGAITAGNTAIQHLGHLSDEAEKLGNFDTSIPGNNQLNAVVNAVKGSGASGTHIANFDSVRNKYIEEATKFYRGTGGNEADLQRDIASLNSAQSPSQLREVIKTQADLMQSKVNALQERWKHGMGPLVEDFPIIQPESKKAIEAINNRQAGKKDEPSTASAAPATGAPDKSAIEAEMRKRGLLK